MTTPEQFKNEMQNEVGGDIESAHIRMDAIMCRVLKELGYKDGIAVFEKQPRWYA
jgi:hypothetical protein